MKKMMMMMAIMICLVFSGCEKSTNDVDLMEQTLINKSFETADDINSRPKITENLSLKFGSTIEVLQVEYFYDSTWVECSAPGHQQECWDEHKIRKFNEYSDIIYGVEDQTINMSYDTTEYYSMFDVYNDINATLIIEIIEYDDFHILCNISVEILCSFELVDDFYSYNENILLNRL